MSISNGTHVFNSNTLVRRLCPPNDRRRMYRIEELARHNNKVAIMRQDMSLGLPRLRLRGQE